MHRGGKKNQIALCSCCCARLFTVIDNSAQARQAPQISLTLTPAREIAFYSMLFGYVDSSPGLFCSSGRKPESQLKCLDADYFLNRGDWVPVRVVAICKCG